MTPAEAFVAEMGQGLGPADGPGGVSPVASPGRQTRKELSLLFGESAMKSRHPMESCQQRQHAGQESKRGLILTSLTR